MGGRSRRIMKRLSESIFRFTLRAYVRSWSLRLLSHNIETLPDRLQEPLRSAALGAYSPEIGDLKAVEATKYALLFMSQTLNFRT
jgi:hypothetical protein